MKRKARLLAVLLFLLTVFIIAGCSSGDIGMNPTGSSPPSDSDIVVVPTETALEGTVSIAPEALPDPTPTETVLPTLMSANNGVPAPLQGVVITVGTKSTKTDSSGYWKISNLKPGKYTLTAKKKNYTTFKQKVTVVKNQVITADFSMQPSFYGWKWQNPLPFKAEFRDIFFVDEETGWAVGERNDSQHHGVILHTEDGGDTWTPQDAGSARYLRSVFFLDRRNGWAGGSNGVLLRTDNGGETWNIENSGTTKAINDIQFINRNLGWLLLDSDKILRTSDGGVTWEEFSTNLSWQFRCQFISKDEGWLTGYSGILHTVDGGATWEQQIIPNFRIYTDVCFIDKNTGWATGTAGTILKTTDGGATWTPQTTGLPYWLNGIRFIDEFEGVAVGAGGTIIRTKDGGNTWTSVGPFLDESVYLTSIFKTRDDNFLIAGMNSALLSSDNGGKSFKFKATVTANPLADVFFYNADYGWGVGAGGTVVLTGNGGKKWKFIKTGITDRLNDVRFISLNKGWAVGAGGTIVASGDGGYTWKKKQSGTTEDLHGVFFFTKTYGWAAGNNGTILATTNGGVTWTPQNSGVTINLSDIFFVNKNEGWAAGGNTVLATSDGGATWVTVFTYDDPVLPVSISRLWFTDAQNGWAVGPKGTIIHYDGTTWNVLSHGSRYGTAHDVQFIDRNHGWILWSGRTGSDAFQELYYTGDGGETWSTIRLSQIEGLNSFFFTDFNTGWAVGDGGAIINTISGGAPHTQVWPEP